MKYAGIINNDVVNGKGVCVSFWSQGCPHRCPGCHNPQTWEFNKGIDGDDDEIIDYIIEMLRKNGVKRNLSILGGEPLCNENLHFTYKLIDRVRKKYPDIIIFIWTGYTFEELVYAFDPPNNVLALQECIMLEMCLRWSNVIIDGRFEKELRDITLPLRGSSNQRVIDARKTFRLGKVVECEEYLNSEV